MLHESPDAEPETIEQRKIVFHHVRVWVARMGIVPLVRAEPVVERANKTLRSIKQNNIHGQDGLVVSAYTSVGVGMGANPADCF